MTLKIPLYINEGKIDCIYVTRVEGDPAGVCKYKVHTSSSGEIGYLLHDRFDGVYELASQALRLVHNKDIEEESWHDELYCPICHKKIRRGETCIKDKKYTYHSDCKTCGKHLEDD